MKNDELKILFIDITKTAGTAITESFRAHFPGYIFEGKHHSIQNFISYGSDIVDDSGLPHKGTCSVVTKQDIQNYITFSVIRNPYDRMVSLWLWGCNTVYGNDFDKFVNDVSNNKFQDFNRVRYRSQVEWICDAEGNNQVSHLLKYETLGQDFAVFQETMGVDKFPLLVRNTALDRSNKQRTVFQNYYSSEVTRQTVEDIWAADFKMFNYEKI